MSEIIAGEHVFQITDFVPYGYIIWNIGSHNMPDGYLPLCRLSAYQPFPGGRNIEVDTLKAIRTDGAEEILKAASVGSHPKELKAFAKKHKNAKRGTWNYQMVQTIKRAMPFLDALDWHY